jgi:hypothetical protein
MRLLIAGIMLATVMQAQQPVPHAGYVYPGGGRAGDTVEVTVGGQFLDGASQVYISGAGVEGSVVSHNKPLTPVQVNQLRQQHQELQKKQPLSAEDRKKIAELRAKLAGFVRRPASPAIAETVTVKVTISPDAPTGERELRLGTAAGLTNPLVFCVGNLPEFAKPAAKPVADVQRDRAPPIAKPEAMSITLPAVVNGQIMPGANDRYRFQAAKGQRLVMAASARRLMPYLSDGVPGWFQATLGLFDREGREVAYADDYRFDPDPVLYYEVPADGEYVLEIKDSIYRGREDFVYRITVGELPFVTSVFPLGGKPGARTSVEVTGWNLPAARITHRANAAGVERLEIRDGQWVSNSVPFMADTLPEHLEREPNEPPQRASSLKIPTVVNGRIHRPGDYDIFRFTGRAGEAIVAEVLARRLNSPLDSILTLTDSSGKRLASNDDYEDKGAGLVTHHADSRIVYKLPKSGNYYVHLADVQRKGGPEYAYRLRISRPQPDFELRVVPASIGVRPGATVPVSVYALRKDGFSGEIALRLKDAPAGFVLTGGWIPAGEDKMRLTLTVPPTSLDSAVSLVLEGRASINGREVRRQGIPAEDMMQAFAWRHLVPAQEWLVRVTGAARIRTTVKGMEGAVKIPAGGTAPARLEMAVRRLAPQMRLVLNDPPEGISIEQISVERDEISVLLRADAAKVQPGLKGNLIVEAFLERLSVPGAKKQTNGRWQPAGMLPAIPFEVVKP